jgi:hypothetical protein
VSKELKEKLTNDQVMPALPLVSCGSSPGTADYGNAILHFHLNRQILGLTVGL